MARFFYFSIPFIFTSIYLLIQLKHVFGIGILYTNLCPLVVSQKMWLCELLLIVFGRRYNRQRSEVTLQLKLKI